MPMPMLTDLARARVQAISFFLVVLLLCAWAVQGIWNGLRDDLPRLPRLSFGKAFGLVTLWGLLFLLVLTMISGARELLTPGAWRKQGLTYTLADVPAPPSSMVPAEPGREAMRRGKLERLRAALWAYARAHDGRFPADDSVSELPAEVWALPDPSGMRYIYVPGRKVGEALAVVAYEPGLYGRDRYTLNADGEVRLSTVEAVREALAVEGLTGRAAGSAKAGGP
jgi:hypothetical protein